jgi:hypothetical protein
MVDLADQSREVMREILLFLHITIALRSQAVRLTESTRPGRPPHCLDCTGRGGFHLARRRIIARLKDEAALGQSESHFGQQWGSAVVSTQIDLKLVLPSSMACLEVPTRPGYAPPWRASG